MRTPPAAVVTAGLLLVIGACAGTSGQQVDAGRARGDATTTSAPPAKKATTTAPPDCAAMLPPEGQAAQLLMVEVIDPSQAAKLLADGTVGGFSLSGNQRSDVAKGIATATAKSPIPPSVAVREEGGSAQSLKYSAGVLPSQGEQAGGTTTAAATQVGQHAAKMAGMGVTMNFAPLAALEPTPAGVRPTTTSSSTTTTRPSAGSGTGTAAATGTASRYFGRDPDTVSPFVVASLKAQQDNKVNPVVKFWPAGTGTAPQKSGSSSTSAPKALPKLAAIDQLRATDMAVFDTAIKAGAPAIMVSNAEVPGLTAAGEPASLSTDAITGELRGREGFDGVVVTETLGTGPVATVAPADEAAERAITAGADIAVVAGADSATAAHDRLVAAIKEGRLDKARVEASVRRVLTLKGVEGECFDAVSSYAAKARVQADAGSSTTTAGSGSGSTGASGQSGGTTPKASTTSTTTRSTTSSTPG